MNCTKVFYAFPMSTANLHSSRHEPFPSLAECPRLWRQTVHQLLPVASPYGILGQSICLLFSIFAFGMHCPVFQSPCQSILVWNISTFPQHDPPDCDMQCNYVGFYISKDIKFILLASETRTIETIMLPRMRQTDVWNTLKLKLKRPAITKKTYYLLNKQTNVKDDKE